MDNEYAIEPDFSCPKCNHSPLHSRDCTNWCEDGFFDEHDEDPVNFSPGEVELPCDECKGTGIERWCPNCGENLSGHQFPGHDLTDDVEPIDPGDILYH